MGEKKKQGKAENGKENPRFFDCSVPTPSTGGGEGEKLLIHGFVLEQLCANELIAGSQEPEPLINPQQEPGKMNSVLQ